MSDERAAVVDRRRVLQVFGAGGVGAALAGCGSSSDDDDAAGDSNTPAATTAAAPTTAAATESAASDDAAVVAAVADVPVGSGVITDEYVVTQPAAGTFKAFTKLCTHQGCPLSSVEKESIVCNCHKSAFSVKDGSVVRGPATKPLTEVPVKVSGSNVVTS